MTIRILVLLTIHLSTLHASAELAGSEADQTKPATNLELTLEACIDTALANNRHRAISRLALEIAEAQHQQALSSYWPQAVVNAVASRRDDHPLFIFPEETSSYAINLGDQQLETAVTIPDKNVRLQDRNHGFADLNITYPIYTSGLRRSLVRQTQAGMQAEQQLIRRTDLEVIRDVKRMFYGGVLAQQLNRIGQEALARLEITLELTENLYQRGSGKVNKTDYLKHKVVVETVRSMIARLETNQELAAAALANGMGLGWQSTVAAIADSVPYLPHAAASPNDLVRASYSFNPDWGRLHAGLDAATARLGEARSGGRPKVALFANVEVIANSHEAGSRKWPPGRP